MRVAIPVFPGVEELDAIAPLEAFGLAKQIGLPVEVALMSDSSDAEVRGYHGLVFGALGLFSETETYDLVVVPGGAWLGGEDAGVRRAVAEGSLARLIRHHFDKGSTVSSVCTGAFLLAQAGLLEGLPATTHHLAQDDLRALGIQVLPDRIVDAGRILTAGGITSGLDLAIHLLEREFGCGERISSILEYPPHVIPAG